MTLQTQEPTTVGSYFISNYPPYSAWRPENVSEAEQALHSPPLPHTPIGLYLHIPFCRKRCKFCYFRVYTDKSARDVEAYLEALTREVELYRDLPVIGPRRLQFVYFGGGTPSFLSVRQLRRLFGRVQKSFPWDGAEEVTFECEPGTLTPAKLTALKDLGITRLSLGVENFDDTILEENGRAHRSPEIYRSYDTARELGFPQINIDLIAGMVGETWENWKACVAQARKLAPDSVTIYQMELPFNTVYSQDMLAGRVAPSVADWPTKRAWVDYAFDELLAAGYEISSAYTLVKDRQQCRFIYRDSVWHGADMIGTGVASFSHVSGGHYQNVDGWGPYVDRLSKGQLPLERALRPTTHQLLIREMILQLKLGEIHADYFRRKFGAEILEEFADAWWQLQQEQMAVIEDDAVRLTQQGLLHADGLLPNFFEPSYRGVRYT